MEHGVEGQGPDRPAEAPASRTDAPTVPDVTQRVAAARATDGFARSLGATPATDSTQVGVDTLHAAARAALDEPVAYGNPDHVETLRVEAGALLASRNANVFPDAN